MALSERAGGSCFISRAAKTRESRSSVFLCYETKRKRLLRRLAKTEQVRPHSSKSIENATPLSQSQSILGSSLLPGLCSSLYPVAPPGGIPCLVTARRFKCHAVDKVCSGAICIFAQEVCASAWRSWPRLSIGRVISRTLFCCRI